MLQDIIHSSCRGQLRGYKIGTSNAYGVIDWVLKELPEYRKIAMAASAVILGLLPTILQSLENSTIDLALLGIRRPLLAILLSITNPTSSMTRTSDWVPSTINQRLAPSGTPIIRISPRSKLPLWLLFSVAKYIIAIVAATSVILITYTLSVNAMIAFAPKILTPLPIWLGLAAVIHIASTIILSLRIQMKHPESQWSASRELVPCVFQAPGTVESRSGKGFYLIFLSFRWLLDVGILMRTIL